MTPDAARLFAEQWFEAWNNHDVDTLLVPYADDIVFISPFAKLMGFENGVILGKAAMLEYYQKLVDQFPDLHFECVNVCVGVKSLVLVYRSVFNLMAAELLEMDEQGRVIRVQTHYSQ